MIGNVVREGVHGIAGSDAFARNSEIIGWMRKYLADNPSEITCLICGWKPARKIGPSITINSLTVHGTNDGKFTLSEAVMAILDDIRNGATLVSFSTMWKSGKSAGYKIEDSFGDTSYAVNDVVSMRIRQFDDKALQNYGGKSMISGIGGLNAMTTLIDLARQASRALNSTEQAEMYANEIHEMGLLERR